MTIRVLMADDHQVVLEGLETLLSLDGDNDVVGTAVHGEELLALIPDADPDDAALAVVIRALQEFPTDERTNDDIERLSALVDDGWEHLANAYAVA